VQISYTSKFVTGGNSKLICVEIYFISYRLNFCISSAENGLQQLIYFKGKNSQCFF
jgi:hypothetical protein